MAEEEQKAQTQGPARKLKLLGNHPCWAAEFGGFTTWRALDVDEILEGDNEFGGRHWQVNDLFAEGIYRELLPVSSGPGGMSIEVYETAYGGEFSFCDQYPYIVVVYFGQHDVDNVNTYFVFCSSFPMMLAVLTVFEPLARQFARIMDFSASAEG